MRYKALVLAVWLGVFLLLMIRVPDERGARFGYGAFSVMAGLLALFPEECGEYLGPAGRGQITRPSPPFLVAAFGWAGLIGLGIMAAVSPYSE